MLIEAVTADSDSGLIEATTGFTAMGLSPEAGCPLGSFPKGGDELITKRLGADLSDDDRSGLENL